MSISLIVALVIVVILVLIYNSLVAKKNQVQNISASVDVMLKKRYDLIPNLVALASRYMEHEKELLTQITSLRALAMKPDISQADKISLDKKLSTALGSVMVAMEAYPELKANENILHLQQSLNEIEEQLSAARRAYNQAITDYNNALEMIPTNFMASAMGYTKKEVFEALPSERIAPNIKELFNSNTMLKNN